MIRVLHIFNMMGNGGIEHYVMDRYRLMDREKIQFDFLLTSEAPGYFDEQIQALGGRVFHTVSFSRHPLASLCQTRRLVKENRYQIVHRHTGNAIAYLDLLAARRGGAGHVILHSHNTSAEKILFHRLAKAFFACRCERLACSQAAGRWMFGHKSFTVMKNAIDTEQYSFQRAQREKIRAECGVAEDALVIGHIGRLDYQKNHSFLLDIFAEVLKRRENAVLLCLGDGFLKAEIERKAEALQIRDRVILAGSVDNVGEWLNGFDVFCLPSNYEGLSFTLLEAQANGLPCFASRDRVPEEGNLTGNVTYIPLEEGPAAWAEAICARPLTRDAGAPEKIMAAGYELKQSAAELARYYGELADA